MRKLLLAAICIVPCVHVFAEEPSKAKSDFAQNLEAIASIAWPLVAIFVVIVLYPS